MTAEPWPPAHGHPLPDDDTVGLARWLCLRLERAWAPRLPVQWVDGLSADGARAMRERYGLEVSPALGRWSVLCVVEEMTGVAELGNETLPSPGDEGAPPDTCRGADGTCDGSCEGTVGEWYPSGRGPWSWVCRCPVSEGYECLRPESCALCWGCRTYRPPLTDRPGERGRRR